jgi:hypothetical protein
MAAPQQGVGRAVAELPLRHSLHFDNSTVIVWRVSRWSPRACGEVQSKRFD